MLDPRRRIRGSWIMIHDNAIGCNSVDNIDIKQGNICSATGGLTVANKHDPPDSRGWICCILH